jgi:GNAT superfamily N-acetyltransferase
VVVGYLLGCVDTTKENEFNRLLGYHAVRRYCVLRPGTAGFMWRAMADVVRDSVIGRHPVPAPFHDEHWPAHLHINLLPEARAGGVGRRLMMLWLDRLRTLEAPGCHVETMAENTRAVGFFEATGFVKYGAPLLVPGMRRREGGRMHVQRLVQDFRTPGTSPAGRPPATHPVSLSDQAAIRATPTFALIDELRRP